VIVPLMPPRLVCAIAEAAQTMMMDNMAIRIGLFISVLRFSAVFKPSIVFEAEQID
jgi:hypothetical protein